MIAAPGSCGNGKLSGRRVARRLIVNEVGMVKYGILLVLSGPLALVVWGEARDFWQRERAAGSVVFTSLPDDQKRGLEETGADARKLRERLEPGARAVLLMTKEYPAIPLEVSGVEKELHTQAATYAQKLTAVEKLLRDPGRLDSLLADDADLRQILKAHQDQLALQREVVQLAGKYAGDNGARLEKLLREYKDKPGCDRHLVLQEMGGLARFRINQAAPPPGELQGALRQDRLLTDLVKTTRERQRLLEETFDAWTDLDDYADTRKLRSWAREQEAQCKMTLAVLEIAQKPGGDTAAERLLRLAELLTKSSGKEQLEQTIRLIAVQQCASYLPERLAPDTEVWFSNQGAGKRKYKRAELQVIWKGPAKGKYRTLDEAPFIFELSDDWQKVQQGTHPEIEKVEPVQAGIGFARSLDATDRTLAADRYNRGRRNVKWTAAGLKALHSACAADRQELGETWTRLDELQRATAAAPHLLK
jgi:hypothetical protein